MRLQQCCILQRHQGKPLRKPMEVILEIQGKDGGQIPRGASIRACRWETMDPSSSTVASKSVAPLGHFLRGSCCPVILPAPLHGCLHSPGGGGGSQAHRPGHEQENLSQKFLTPSLSSPLPFLNRLLARRTELLELGELLGTYPPRAGERPTSPDRPGLNSGRISSGRRACGQRRKRHWEWPGMGASRVCLTQGDLSLGGDLCHSVEGR